MVMTARAVVCLCLCMSVCQIRAVHFSVEMNKTIQNLLQHYNIPRRQLFKGDAIFPKDQLAIRTEANKVFMLDVLDKYEQLIGQMLDEMPTPSPQTNGIPEADAVVVPTPGTGGADTRAVAAGVDVRKELNSLLTRIKSLRRHHYQEQERILQGMKGLTHIKIKDRMVQAKALFELSRVYEEASVLTNDTVMQRRRRRRQTRRAKTQLRA